MKRNMKFLLLLAIFATSIMAAYFISGCGDDITEGDTIINQDNTNDTITVVETMDRVIGTITGTVRDGYDNSFLPGVMVTWTNGSTQVTTTTDAKGYYSTPVDLPSGGYEFTFSRANYAITSGFDDIPDLDELRSDDHNVPAGDIYYTEVLDAWLLPLTATVTGKVYTALPAPPGKDGEAVLALDDPTLVSVAFGVTVILDYGAGFNIHSDKYDVETDITGTYTFLDVPLVFNSDEPWWEDAPKGDGPGMALADAWEVDIVILPFTEGGQKFESVRFPDIHMLPGTTTLPNIYAPLKGSGDDPDITDNPVVLAFNFDTPGFMVTDDLTISFSKAMDPNTVTFLAVTASNDTVDYAASWDANFWTLTIDPALSLVPDDTVEVEITGMSADGLPLWDSKDHNNLWNRDLQTQQGIRFVATNLDDYGDDSNPFTDFPLGNDITITFDMDAVLPTPGDELTGWVVLYDTWNGREVNALVSASGATITITPTNALKNFNEYWLDFKVFSNLRGDFATDAEVKSPNLTFSTVNLAPIPLAPTNFVLDMGAGWKADFNTLEIDFQWDSVGGAEYYQIFAMDNNRNTDLIVVNDYIEDISFHTMQVGSVDFAKTIDTIINIDTTVVEPLVTDTTYDYVISDDENLSFDLYFDDAIQTPFSAGTQITFQVRAVNASGAGPFSAEIVIGDETPPDFNVYVVGCADNTAGTEAMMFDIEVEGDFDGDLEYVSTIAFAFLEMGGDPAFMLTSGDIAWDWDVDMRNGEGVGTVAIGMCGSADYMVVSITDNSGNTGVDTMDLESYIVITEPNAATTEFEAPSFDIEWSYFDSDCDAFSDAEYIDLYFSWDGGATWTDTVFDWDYYDEGDASWSVLDTVFTTTAMIGLSNSNGGYIWKSDVFTHNGIMLTGPDEDWLADTTIYDAEGVDSTGIPLTFDYIGADSVGIWYRTEGEGWGSWVLYDSIAVSGGTGSYTFYPPDLGDDYNCMVKVAEFDANARPAHMLAWEFWVINDWVSLTAPINGEMVPGGSTPYDITWDTVWTPGSKVQLAYSVNDGTTWDTIIDSTANSGTYPWTVPATTFADNTAWLRIIDKWDNNVLDQVGPFSISGIVIDAPIAGTEWLVGTGQDIEWHSVGNVGNISMYWSDNGFFDDSTLIVTNWAGGSPFNWTIPANSASANITIRLYGNTDAVYTTSGVMTFAGAVVTAPISGNVAQGSSTTITWNTIGTLMGNVDIEYKYDTSGVISNWISLASNIPDTNSWLWNPIPAPPAEEVWVRVKNAGTSTGIGQGAAFSIAGVIVRTPNGSEVWTRGNTYDITWDVITATVGDLRIELSTNAGVDWTTLAVDVDPALETWSWTIDGAETVSDACMIRISEMSGTITDASNAFFDID